jgi:alanyl-tRNA synthetase
MKKRTGNEIRQSFLDFFHEKGHLVLPSASLIPENDPSLLLIGAGMAPFKTYFTGVATPPSGRVTNSQKCIRTPDIERVGKTARHATCFEMLGNFSFGDYFKRDAIHWAWEFLTERMEMDPARLYVTVHKDDKEAYDIWHKEVGVPVEHLVLGDEDNFWEIGTGPCGPCSEIFYDQGEEFKCDKPNCVMGCDCDRYLEIWNLVFTQYDKDENGEYHPLERKCIDTGLGLDRIAAVIQGAPSIFEMDLNLPMLNRLIELSKVNYDGKSSESLALRVILDHVRGVTFLIADGVLPGNEGRGYVLRRLLRRAVRFGRIVGLHQPFVADIAAKVIDSFKVGYPDLEDKRSFILQVFQLEEKRFNETLESGLSLVQQFIEEMKQSGKTELQGEVAFRLHDTFGFPLELTQEILEEQGYSVDIQGFRDEMNRQRQRARAARQDVDAMGANRTDLSGITSSFIGYDTLRETSTIQGIFQEGKTLESAEENQQVQLVLEPNPFYGESGGQVGDSGYIEQQGIQHPVIQTTKEGQLNLLTVEVKTQLKVGDQVLAIVDEQRRKNIARHHSATHLLHKALRLVLGDHIHQAGSWVGPDRLRFDFSHFSALEQEQVDQVEYLVNQWIMEDYPVSTEELKIDEARAKGATALFGEKYGDVVRVIEMGDSMELCGGTHVHRTGEIGPFEIVSEAGIGSGLRRIEALSGWKAFEYYQNKENVLSEMANLLKSKEDELPSRISQLLSQLRETEKKLESLSAKNTADQMDDLLKGSFEIEGVPTVIARVSVEKADDLRQMADILRDKMGRGIVVLAAEIDGKASLLAAATKDLVKIFHAGNLIREAAKLVGGGGGGRPDLAQAGGKNPEKLPEAMEQIRKLVEAQFEKH